MHSGDYSFEDEPMKPFRLYASSGEAASCERHGNVLLKGLIERTDMIRSQRKPKRQICKKANAIKLEGDVTNICC